MANDASLVKRRCHSAGKRSASRHEQEAIPRQQEYLSRGKDGRGRTSEHSPSAMLLRRKRPGVFVYAGQSGDGARASAVGGKHDFVSWWSANELFQFALFASSLDACA